MEHAREQANSADTYFLEPGFIFMAPGAVSIRTVLGSCVAVCLWDKQRPLGGMNHFIHPRLTAGRKPTAQYGDVAMPMLLRMMLEEGCQPSDLTAQIFGGASPPTLSKAIPSEQNIEVARQFLKRRGIKVVSEDVGGTLGRKLLFDVATGQVAILKVHEIRASDWDPGLPRRDGSETWTE